MGQRDLSEEPRSAALHRQLRSIGPVTLAAFLAVGIVYVVAWGLAKATDRQPTILTEDPANLLEAPLYTGAFQYLSFLGWWTAAVLAGATGMLLYRRGHVLATPLLGLAAISSWLVVDDMFQMHEAVLDGHAGIPQYVTFSLYGVMAAAFFWHVRWFVMRTDWLLLVLFVIIFGAGQVFDQAGDEFGHHYTTAEKGLELLGVTAWVLYVSRCSLRYLTVPEPIDG